MGEWLLSPAEGSKELRAYEMRRSKAPSLHLKGHSQENIAKPIG
jgi:hypothetical protein